MMAALSPAQIDALLAAHRAAEGAGHGQKAAIYRRTAESLGMSLSTLHRHLGSIALRNPRKRRIDAGGCTLDRAEAELIAATIAESARKNGKRLYSVADAVDVLRANGMLRAEFVDTATGEVRPLSLSAIRTGMRRHGLHPDQINAPAPAVQLASLHPNHVWQIDASLCVLYYLNNGMHRGKGQRESGLQVMAQEVFYKNKPKNLARIAADRVWSYEITDHATGWIYVEYVLGAESGQNLQSVLINAMQERSAGQDGVPGDVLHGVPDILFMDPGSANTASSTRNLCRALGIRMIAHAPGNARATGQVENARNIIERKFEAALKFQTVDSLEEINRLAAKWRAHFNATAVHSRHGKTRTAYWLSITAAQLIKAPSVEVCRELAVADPEKRKVNPFLRISFRGAEYDVSSVPGVQVGENLLVTRNPWRADAAQIVLIDEAGRDVFHVVPRVEKTEAGFAVDAPVIGESYRRHADTPAQQTAARLEQIITGTENVEDAAEARKAIAKGRTLPFGGRLDPFKHIDDADMPTFLPKRGTAHGLNKPRVIEPPLSHTEAAMTLKARLPGWSAAHYQHIVQLYPEGVPAEAVDHLHADLLARFHGAPGELKVVGGRA